MLVTLASGFYRPETALPNGEWHYEPWDREHLVLDTATGAPDQMVERAVAYMHGVIG